MTIGRAALCAAALLVAVLNARTGALAQGDLLPVPEVPSARGINFPALSPDAATICFSYLGDLWAVPAAGGAATRLTIHEAHDGFPRWSPDGKWVAFASNRYGGYDIFLAPAEGGPARRLTEHSANDYPMDWSADGKTLLFYSMRGTERWQLYTIDLATRVVRTLTDDGQYLRFGTWSPDGKVVAYNRSGGTATWWRPRYRGSANFDVYTRALPDGKVTRVTDYDGNDLWPMWSADGKRLFYVTDEVSPGAPNLVSVGAAGGRPRLLTHHAADAVRWPTIARNGSTIAYVWGGDLYTVSTRGGSPAKVAVRAPTDDKENQVERLRMTADATEAEVAPDGKTLVLVIRGELWTLPTDRGGDAKRVTDHPANDFDVMWSPDSTRLVFASDRKGNFDIHTLDVKTGELKQLTVHRDDESSPHFSPDGKRISFLRSGAEGGLYVVPADGSGAPVRLAPSQGNNLFGVGILDYAWSPDSRWLAFTRRDTTNTNDIWVVPAAGGDARNVTYYPGSNLQPQWTADGKYLLFRSAREGPMREDVYAIPLQRRRADEEEAAAAAPPSPGRPGGPGGPGRPRGPGRPGPGGPAAPGAPEPQGPSGPDAPAQPAQPARAAPPVEVKIDFDDIENRARRVTAQGGGPYQVTPDGRAIVYIAGGDYWMATVDGGPAQRLTGTSDAAGLPRFAADPGRFWVMTGAGGVRAIQRMGPAWSASPVAFAAILDLDRRVERAQAFNEFWRRMRVGFYDPNMHGVDWDAVKARYEPLLQGVGTREEFALYLLSPMVGELNASHSEVTPPPPSRPSPETADLGITFDETYAGPGLKVKSFMPDGPNDDLGPRVKPGEYVLKIDGQDVAWNESLWAALLDKAGKTVEVLVNGKASADGARTVKLTPVTAAAWRDLEYQRKVKAARAEVEKLSGGRVGYIHIRGMDQPSLRQMQRELWGRAREKDGLVLDVRDNGGGNTHDEILAQLSRPAYALTRPRDGEMSTQPFRHWDKPTALLINRNSVSDAEVFPYGFRSLKLGKVLGERTPGYVIGTYTGRLQDGTSYRVPMWGWFALDGVDLENRGVAPDIEVVHTGDDIAAGRDRQLQVAVETVLRDLPRK